MAKKSKGNTALIVGALAVLAVGGTATAVVLSGSSKEKSQSESDSRIREAELNAQVKLAEADAVVQQALAQVAQGKISASALKAELESRSVSLSDQIIGGLTKSLFSAGDSLIGKAIAGIGTSDITQSYIGTPGMGGFFGLPT